jgi:hypothetical protein
VSHYENALGEKILQGCENINLWSDSRCVKYSKSLPWKAGFFGCAIFKIGVLETKVAKTATIWLVAASQAGEMDQVG